MKRLYYTALTNIFMWLGVRVFDYIVHQEGADGQTTSLHFAKNEREFNISIRTIVEGLDEQYESR